MDAKVLKGQEARGPLKKVLYVEDEDDNWEIAALLLKSKFNLTRASNAREACDAARTIPNLYAILMDIQLTGSDLDGIHLTKLLRGTLPPPPELPYAQNLPRVDVPIIFMTAYGSRYSESTLMEAGGDLLVTKPVDFGKLTLSLASISIRRVHKLLSPAEPPAERKE